MNDEIIVINTSELDFLISVVLSETEYKMGFTWNNQNNYWTISLYTEDDTVIFEGRKVVKDYNLFAFCSNPKLPKGKLFAIDQSNSKLDISKEDLSNGRILLTYIQDL